MTEISRFWDGLIAGDATSAPYSARSFRDPWSKLLVINEASNGIVKGGLGVQSVLLFGDQWRVDVAPGSAIVKGVMYVNDAPVYFLLNRPTSGTYYYAIVLRYFGNKVRLAVLGPSISGNPTLTQTSTQFELLVAYIRIPAGASPVIDRFVNRLITNDREKIIFTNRIGGHVDNFSVAGTTTYVPSFPTGIQVGVRRWTGGAATSGSVVVTFPKPFSKVPIGFATVVYVSSLDSRVHATANIENITTTQMTIYWSIPFDGKTEIDFHWMAIGTMFYE